MPDYSALKVAVIGYGSIGRRHVDNLLALGVQNPVVVRRRESNPAFTPPPEARVAHSIAQALATGVQLAIVCNPTSLHVQTAEQFLAAGVSLLVEKPLADSLAPATAIVNRAAAGRAKAAMAYCLRFHPAYRQARDLLQGGAIGRLLYAKAWFETYLPGWHPWEDHRRSYAARRDLGGGVPITLDHELDFLLWCCGPPTRVDGWTANTGALEVDVPDLALVSMQFGDGALAHVQLSLCRRRLSRGFALIGEAGELCYDFDSAMLTLVGGSRQGPAIVWDGRDYNIDFMYRDLLAAVLTATERGDFSDLPGLAAGAATLAIAAACTSVRP